MKEIEELEGNESDIPVYYGSESGMEIFDTSKTQVIVGTVIPERPLRMRSP